MVRPLTHSIQFIRPLLQTRKHVLAGPARAPGLSLTLGPEAFLCI